MLSQTAIRTLALVWVPALAAARLLHPPYERPYTVGATKHPITFTQKLLVANGVEASTARTGGRTAADRNAAAAAADDSTSADSGQLNTARLWPDVSGLRTPQGCPGWMSDYAAFHARQRGQPGARYAARQTVCLLPWELEQQLTEATCIC